MSAMTVNDAPVLLKESFAERDAKYKAEQAERDAKFNAMPERMDRREKAAD